MVVVVFVVVVVGGAAAVDAAGTAAGTALCIYVYLPCRLRQPAAPLRFPLYLPRLPRLYAHDYCFPFFQLWANGGGDADGDGYPLGGGGGGGLNRPGRSESVISHLPPSERRTRRVLLDFSKVVSVQGSVNLNGAHLFVCFVCFVCLFVCSFFPIPSIIFATFRDVLKSTHDAYENTWKCGELKLYFSSSAGG